MGRRSCAADFHADKGDRKISTRAPDNSKTFDHSFVATEAPVPSKVTNNPSAWHFSGM